MWRLTRRVKWETTTQHRSKLAAQAEAARSMGDVMNLEPGQAAKISERLEVGQPLEVGPYIFTLEERS